MSLKPLGDRIVVKQDDAETKTASGLLIASTAQEKPSQGKVISVGPGKHDNNGKLVKPEVKAGDHVLYSKYGGTEISYKGEDLVILRADDIYAVL